MWKRIFIVPAFIALSGCGLSSDESSFYVFNYAADFGRSLDEWTGDFADYPAGENDSIEFELRVARESLPSNLNAEKALMISGNNHSDDLFMFIKRKVTGLSPSTDYTIAFDIELASNAPIGSAGIGGAPGESVFLKVGAVPSEPKKVIEKGYYRMNIDKGNQSQSGEDMTVIGNIAVAANTTDFTRIVRSNTSSNAPFQVRSSSKGELWLIIGTDSGFEGVTTLYYTQVNVVFSISK